MVTLHPEIRSSTGLPANVAGALCYPLGLITGLAFLALERDSAFVRFHAFQATLASIVATVVLEGARFSPLPAPEIVTAVGIVALFLFLCVGAFRGDAYELPWIGPAARARLERPAS